MRPQLSRSTSCLRAAIAVAVIVLLVPAAATGAAAKPKPKPKKAKPAAVATAAPAPAADHATPTTAKGWYEKGATHHKLREFPEALRCYKEAFRLDPIPLHLYNLAVVYRLMGNATEALEYYRNFVKEDPKSKLRAEAEARIAELSKLVGLATKVKDTEPKGPASPSAPPTGPVTKPGHAATAAATPTASPPPRGGAEPGAMAPPGTARPGASSAAVTAPPPSERKRGPGLAIGLAAGGGALVVGGAIAAILLFGTKGPVDRLANGYTGAIVDDRSLAQP